MFQVLKRMSRLAGEYRKNLITAYIVSFFEAVLEKAPVFMILYVFVRITAGALQTADFWFVLSVVLCSLVISVFLRYIREKNQSGSGYMIFARERLNLGEKIKRLPMSYFTEGNIGNLTAVITSDIKFIEEMGITQLTTITTSFITLLVTLVMLAFFNPYIAFVMFCGCLLVTIVFREIQKIAKKHSAAVQEQQQRTTSAVIEYIKGMQVIKAFHLVGDQQKRTSALYCTLSNTQFEFEKKFVVPAVISDSIIALSIGAVIGILALSFQNGELTLPAFLMLIIFSFEIFRPLSSLVNVSAEIRLMEACLDRYESVQQERTITDVESKREIKNFDIEFRDVSFSYKDSPVLQNVNFHARAKAMTALVGKSGSGKTTICNLISRFWDCQDGQILLGGVDIREMSFEQLISNISVVFQKVYLFNDTIYNNIAFGKINASREEIMEAARKARCYDFIMALPDGFDTMVGEGGATLSGGEKQRISIARAILKDAPIILLDEATASVDPDNEHFIQQAIGELVAEKTLIVIAHKLTTIRNASQILVLDNGKIVESGTHDELLGKNGIYKKMWEKRAQAALGKWTVAMKQTAKEGAV